ncbi:hypothetical protein [Borreliella mayonii]|uniref:hypothetical protein n=1 Tax=Borreliella mayonii TaxID=1674146 RepID=UPI000AA14793|nr:hypothetical protein [Borreliella mayonii]
MKYKIIAGLFVFLLLNACNPDFNTNQKDMKYNLVKKGQNPIKKDYNPVKRC